MTMVHILKIIFFLIVFPSTSLFAQQNLFNIPSGQITPESGSFFQQQINIDGTSQIASKSHYVYGLGEGWEIGVNAVNFYFDLDGNPHVINFDYEEGEYPLNPLLLATLQKGFKLYDELSLNFGTQYGVNLSRRLNNKRNTHFSYSLLSYHPFPGTSFIAGAYVSDKKFLGDSENAGVLLGYEIPLIEDTLYAMGDFISGSHSQGNSVVGVMYKYDKGFEICLGALIPNPNNSEKPAIVFELNLYDF